MTTTEQTRSERNSTFLIPYVFFGGRCADALEFYKGIFGGTYEIVRIGDTPMAEQYADAKDRIMHAWFNAPGISFYCSDGMEDKAIDPDAGNVSIALNIPEADKGDKIFAALSEGGKVLMPLGQSFWGGRFGIVQDKFGSEWMFTTS